MASGIALCFPFHGRRAGRPPQQRPAQAARSAAQVAAFKPTKSRFIGLDVHAETIAVTVAEPAGEVRSLGLIPNRSEPIRRVMKKLGPVEQLWVCYEAGPTGYVVYWQLTSMRHSLGEI